MRQAVRPVICAALPPAVFGDAARAIASSRMPGDVRFVVEKPFGSDAATARELHDEMVDRHSVGRVAIELRERGDAAVAGQEREHLRLIRRRPGE